MFFQLLRQVVSSNSQVFSVLYFFTVILLGIVAPFVIGRTIAARIRMADYGWKIGLIVMSLLLSFELVGRTWNPHTHAFDIKLGVDLQGGVILIYEVEEGVTVVPDEKGKPKQQTSGPGDTSFSMGALIEALSRRINPTGTKEIVIRPYGERQVEIIVPEVDQREVDQIKKTISTAGVLQFRIVANTRDHDDVINLAVTMSKDAVAKRGRVVRDEKGKSVGLWVRVSREQKVLRGVHPFKLDVTQYTLRNSSTGDILAIPATAVASRDDDERRIELAEYVKKEGIHEIDVLMATDDGYDVNGSHLGTVSRGYDEVLNPCIHFNLKGIGVGLFSDLTGDNAPDGQFKRQLGIVLDNELLSAPNIQERITGQGRITGRFTQEEVDFLVNILQAGSLPVVLNKVPIAENSINPLLGKETVESSQIAMAVSLALVFAVVCWYYRYSGFIASTAMAVNLLYILATMILIKAALTLPGIAGLVLTVGMSIDANVLIYERMREEMAKGSTLRMAIRNGFARATVTIIDSNLTTIITALVLYAIGTDQIRGFAVTLILGILVSMFTAIFCARVVFDISERTRFMTKLNMKQFFANPNYDFVGKQFICLGVSVALIIVGMICAALRGREIFDIDFNGGTSVHMLLKQPTEANVVRGVLNTKFRELNKQYTLTGMSKVGAGSASIIFKVDSSIEQVEDLQKAIEDACKKSDGKVSLATYSLTRGPLRRITTSAPASTPKPTTKDSKPAAAPVDKPAAESPAPAKPEAAPAPETKKQSSSDRKRGDTLLAWAGDMDNLLAYADTAAPKEPAAPAASPGPAEKPAEKPAAPPEAVKPAAGEQPKAPASTARAEIEVPLTFAYDINFETLRGEINDAARAVNVPVSYFDLLNPEYQGGSNAFKNWTLKIAADEAQTTKLLDHLAKQFSDNPVWPSSSKIGSQVAGKMQNKAVVALVVSWIAIILYIWIRFQHITYGLGAVIALVHDVMITIGALAATAWLAPFLGFLGIEEFKINMTVVAAILTIIGYSVNDTIVVFDRIREVRGKSPRLTYDMVNLSLNQTLSRTLLTGSTTMIVLVVLYGWGGEGIHAFCFTLLVGVVIGTFSSLYVATPVVLWITGVRESGGSKASR